MIYLIIDVHYQNNTHTQSEYATVAGIRFQGIEHNHILSKHSVQIDNIVPYQSGQFYKREMPCILALLAEITEPYDVIIIDGYVYLDGIETKGLGKHLYDNLTIVKPIIGIAKNKFHTIKEDYAVYRGTSKHPLYVTSIGIDKQQAMTIVTNLEGQNKLPNIVKMVDHLSRKILT